MSTTTPRRWNGFVCPRCRSVFRVATDHDGRGIVCPECRAMLRLAQPGQETPPLVVKEASRRRHRHSEHHREKRAQEIFDETFAGKSGTDPLFGRILAASALTLVALAAVGLLWHRGGGEAPAAAGSSPVPTPPVIEPDLEPRVLSVAVVRDELEPVVRAFLEAPDLETAARWTARSERTLDRMRAHHGGHYQPSGLGGVLWNQSMTRGEGWASFRIETTDYERRSIFLVRQDGWKIDWESWVGWSPMTWEQLKERRPTETVRVRALVRPTEYYNFGFAVESEWASFNLSSPNDASSIYGYVPRGSELHSRISFLDGTTERRMILDIRYPENAPMGNQVRIEGITGEDWLDTSDLP